MHISAGTIVSHSEWYGLYQSDFSIQAYRWDDKVLQKLVEMEVDLESRQPAERRKEAVKLHLPRLRSFYLSVGNANLYRSHSICLCCLREPVEHELPCGHFVCTPCAIDYGSIEDEKLLYMKLCPLHEDIEWQIPRLLTALRPPSVALRVLSLDG